MREIVSSAPTVGSANYLERRDPDFDRKMREVLMVYREVSLQAARSPKEAPLTDTAVYLVAHPPRGNTLHSI